MRRVPLIAAVYAASAALAACSSATATAPAAALPSGTHQSCASTLAAWLHGPGGGALHSVLTAGSAMGAALESGSLTRAAAAAAVLNSAASRADSQLPPACADHGSAYQIGMHDWMVGASDASHGNLKGTSTKIAAGARVIVAVTALQRLSPTVLRGLSRQVAIPTESAAPAPAAATTAGPSTAPSAASQAPSSAPAAAPTQAAPTPTQAATPAGCYPISDEGTCYEPGEYCREDDHGTSGVAGDGKAITCEDNDGWRWEPA
jgi:hypothetical protein